MKIVVEDLHGVTHNSCHRKPDSICCSQCKSFVSVSRLSSQPETVWKQWLFPQ